MARRTQAVLEHDDDELDDDEPIISFDDFKDAVKASGLDHELGDEDEDVDDLEPDDLLDDDELGDEEDDEEDDDGERAKAPKGKRGAADDELEDDEDEGQDEQDELSAAERRRYTQILKDAGVSANRLVGITDQALRRSAEALGSEESLDSGGKPVEQGRPKAVDDLLTTIGQSLDDSAAAALKGLVEYFEGQARDAKAEAAKAREQAETYADGTKGERFARTRESLSREFPSLAKPEVARRVRAQMDKLERTRDYDPVADQERLMRDACRLLDIGSKEKAARRAATREKGTRQLRRNGQPQGGRHRSRSSSRGSRGKSSEQAIAGAFLDSVRKHGVRLD